MVSMKKESFSFRNKRMLFLLLIAFMVVSFSMNYCTKSVFAANCGGAETNFLECGADEGGPWHIISLILDIVSLGVAILGVIAIVAVGIQYMSAGSNTAQVQKAKTRISEIIIGLAAYSTLFAFIEWIMPGGIIGPESEFARMGSTNQVEEIRGKQQAAIESGDELRGYTFDDEGSGGGGGGSGSGSESIESASAEEVRNRIDKVAKEFAREKGFQEVDLKKAKSLNSYQQAVLDTGTVNSATNTCGKMGKACSAFVAAVIRTVVNDDRGKKWPAKTWEVDGYVKEVNKKHPGTWDEVSCDKLQAGDIINASGHHIALAVEKNGKIVTAQASIEEGDGNPPCGGSWPHITSQYPVDAFHSYGHYNLTCYRFMGGDD